MLYRKLGDICTVVSGTTPRSTEKEYWGGQLIWITPAEIEDDTFKVFDSERHITPLAVEKSGLKSFPKGTVILSSRAPIGKVAIAGCEMYCNQGFKNLVCSHEIYNEYLYFYLKAKKNYLQSLGRGATFKEISKKIVEDIKIPIPKLEEQQQIAKILYKIEMLIQCRKKQIKKFNELVESRFIELFGDPISNAFNWKQKSLCEVTSKIGSGATPRGGKESYQDEGIAFIRSMNVHDGRFEYKDLAYITDKQATQLGNVTVEENDVFINITGTSVARSCIVPAEVLPARVNQHVSIIRCVKNQLNPVFANNMFLNDRFKRKLLDMGESGGATRQAITKQQLERLIVILPPMELQDKFAFFSAQVDKSKYRGKKSWHLLYVFYKKAMDMI